MLSSAKLHTALLGHNASVTDVHFSNNSDLALTCADDRTARLWTIEKREQNVTASRSASASANNFNVGECVLVLDGVEMGGKKFEQDVHFAQFYYVDEFMLLASGERLYLFDYDVDLTKPTCNGTTLNTKFTMRKQFAFPTECNQLTAMSAVNTFYSSESAN